jgi:hypothetical protein
MGSHHFGRPIAEVPERHNLHVATMVTTILDPNQGSVPPWMRSVGHRRHSALANHSPQEFERRWRPGHRPESCVQSYAAPVPMRPRKRDTQLRVVARSSSE